MITTRRYHLSIFYILTLTLGLTLSSCGSDDVADEGKTSLDATGGDGSPCKADSECDDGDSCTVDDLCQADGTCVGEPRDCDDDNPCTQDKCDPGSETEDASCVGDPVDGPCEDGSVCTSGDACADGVCVGKPLICADENPCTADSCDAKSGCVFLNDDGSGCEDGDACTLGDTCAGGSCKKGGASKECAEAAACESVACDPKSGKCVTTDVADGGACDDGDACTSKDNCAGGVCVGLMKDCDDDELCTVDSCDKTSGDCGHDGAPLVKKACDDGSVCTKDDTCADGTCAPGAEIDCSDANPCTADACDLTKGCTSTMADGITCDDGDACTSKDTCAAGFCSGAEKDCNDDESCTADSCNKTTGDCAHDGAAQAKKPCDDGSVCTKGDTCGGGKCVPGPKVDCSDANPCTTDVCDLAKGCSSTNADGIACDDGDACTAKDSCVQGACVAGASACACATDADCKKVDDGNPCNGVLVCVGSGTAAKCEPAKGSVVLCDASTNPCADLVCQPATGKCAPKSKADGVPCDADGSKCTKADACSAGTCKKGTALVCDDGNPCTKDFCDAKAGCKVQNDDGAACDDGLACTVAGSCKAGACTKGAAVVCDASTNPCADLVCQLATGKCTPKLKADGVLCDADGSKCTKADACNAGVCEKGAVLLCDDGKPCTKNFCDATLGCQVLNDDGATCDDGLACTVDDACKSGVCVKGSPKDCDDGTSCTTDGCDTKTGKCLNVAVKDGTACDADGSVCTGGDACAAGICKTGEAKTCNDGNKCTNDECDSKTGCAFPINAAACEDGNACTTGDACSGGTCKAGKPLVCDDGNKCTSDSCSTKKGCEFSPISGCYVTPPTWTVLVYMAADNNLEPSAIDDIKEMLKVQTSSKFRFVIQIDRSKGYTSKPIGTVSDFTSTKRFVIEATGKLKQIKDIGETNTGSPKPLQNFITWGLKTYPAERVGLVLWNHGNAWQGFGGDEEESPHDLLTLPELSQALTDGMKGGQLKAFDFIGFDACLMGALPVAKIIKPLSRWFIASADLEPGHGWDWTAFDSLAAIPTSPMTVFGPALLKAFKQQAKDENSFSSITLALYDLDHLDEVETLVNKLTYELGKDLSKTAVQFGRARGKALDYGRDQVLTKSYHMADIGHFAQEVANEVATFSSLKDQLSKALAKLVVDEVHGPVTADTTGLSMYFPPAKALYAKSYSSVSGMSTWRSTLTSFHTWADTFGVQPKVIRADSGSGGKGGLGPNDVVTLPKHDDFRCGASLAWWTLSITSATKAVKGAWQIRRSPLDNKCRLMLRKPAGTKGCSQSLVGTMTTPWLDKAKIDMLATIIRVGGKWTTGSELKAQHSADGTHWVFFGAVTGTTWADIRSLAALYPKAQKFKLRFTMTVPKCVATNQPGPEIDAVNIEPVTNHCLNQQVAGYSCDQADLVKCDGKGLSLERKLCRYGCKAGAKAGQAACEGEVTGVPGEVELSCVKSKGQLVIKAKIQKEFISSAVDARLRFGHFGSFLYKSGLKPSEASYLYTPLVFGERPASIAADGTVQASWDQKVLIANHEMGQTIFHAQVFPTSELDHYEAPVMVEIPSDNPCPCLKAGDKAYGDKDNDKISDCVDRDVDGDGILNHVDNCRFISNGKQADKDKDGIGDACLSNGKPDPMKGKPKTTCSPTPNGRYYTGVLFLDFKPGTTSLLQTAFYAWTATGVSEVKLPVGAVVRPLTRIPDEVSAYSGLPPTLESAEFGPNEVFQPMVWGKAITYRFQPVSEALFWKGKKPQFNSAGRPVYLSDNYEINDLYLEVVVRGVGDKVDSIIYKGSVPENCKPKLSGCSSGFIRDCRGVCVKASLLANNVCDEGSATASGAAGPDLRCERHAYDNGDCSACQKPGYIRDCRGRCHPASVILSALGDGICHDGAHNYKGLSYSELGTGPDLSCATHSFDLGDCAQSTPYNRQKCARFDHDWTCDGVCLPKSEIQRELRTPGVKCRSRYNCAKHDWDADRCDKGLLSVLKCTPSCKNGGKCLFGKCKCASGWKGRDCTVPRSSGPCCAAQTKPRCVEPFVSSCVCSRRPSCCLTKWDARCAEIAQTFCAANCGASTSCADGKCAQPPKSWVGKASVGQRHGCAIDVDGKVRCWGNNQKYQLANTGPGSSTPKYINNHFGKVFALAAGVDFTVALLLDNSKTYVRSWGVNNLGQLGNGTTAVTSKISWFNASKANIIAAGSMHACVSRSDKKTFCWGANSWGQVGNGSKSTAVKSWVEVKSLSGIQMKQLSLGWRHSCALTTGGVVWCWGRRKDGELGDGTQILASSWSKPKKVSLPGSAQAVSIAAGRVHTCAATTVGLVYCWGLNTHGQLGQATIGKAYRSATKVGTTIQPSVIAVAAGANHTCAIGKTGKAQCFGANEHDQLGSYGGADYIYKPSSVRAGAQYKELTAIAQISGGGNSTCAVTGIQSGVGTLKCWGKNDSSQLSLGYGGDAICDPKCTNKSCGAGCGDATRCGSCSSGNSCDDKAGLCAPCKGSCQNKVCGSDGCTGWCGSCPSGKKCKSGKCVPTYGCDGACNYSWLKKGGSLCACYGACGENGLMPCCADRGKTCK